MFLDTPQIYKNKHIYLLMFFDTLQFNLCKACFQKPIFISTCLNTNCPHCLLSSHVTSTFLCGNFRNMKILKFLVDQIYTVIIIVISKCYTSQETFSFSVYFGCLSQPSSERKRSWEVKHLLFNNEPRNRIIIFKYYNNDLTIFICTPPWLRPDPTLTSPPHPDLTPHPWHHPHLTSPLTPSLTPPTPYLTPDPTPTPPTHRWNTGGRSQTDRPRPGRGTWRCRWLMLTCSPSDLWPLGYCWTVTRSCCRLSLTSCRWPCDLWHQTTHCLNCLSICLTWKIRYNRFIYLFYLFIILYMTLHYLVILHIVFTHWLPFI